MKTLSRDLRSRALHEIALPIAYDASAMPGARVLGSDGREYVSIRWPEVSDPYTWVSAAQIAEDVSADVARLSPPDLLVRVGPGPVLEGERYPTLTAALQYMSGFVSSYRDDFVFRSQPWILIESGVVLSEQIIATGVRFGDVVLTSEDEIVYYDLAALVRGGGTPGIGEGIVHNFMTFRGGSTPRITGVRFQPLAESVIPQDPDLVAQHGAYTPKSRGILFGNGASAVIGARSIDLDGTSITPRLGGFEGATFNARSGEGTSLSAGGATFDDAGEVGLRTAGSALLAGVVARGCGSHGLRLAGGSVLFPSNGSGPDGVVPGVFGLDFRNTEGVDSPEDIVVSGGARVHINAPVSNFRGGFSIPYNTFTPSGTVTQKGVGNRTYTQDNIVGTVNQSGGAAFQRDSNDDGDYVRFADGTQICWHVLVKDRATSAGLMGGFRSGDIDWTYPATFSESPVVLGMPQNATAFGVAAREDDAGTASASLVVTNVTSQGTDERRVRAFAIGRCF